MKVPHFFKQVLCLVGVLLMAGAAQAATRTETVSLDISNFAYDSNFWAGRFPTATVGGPAPVTDILLAFTLSYTTPIADAYGFGYRVPGVTGFTAGITAQDIAGFSQAAQTVTATSTDFLIQRRVLGAAAAEYDLHGSVKIATNGGSINNPLVALDFVLPGFFSGTGLSGTETATYRYDSPKPFDSPVYAASALSGGSFTLQRSQVSVTPGPVPVPASLLLGLTGIGALLGLSRRRRPV